MKYRSNNRFQKNDFDALPQMVPNREVLQTQMHTQILKKIHFFPHREVGTGCIFDVSTSKGTILGYCAFF
jgi:hypothetical protein